MQLCQLLRSSLALAAFSGTALHADLVEVRIHGSVEYNAVTSGPLAAATPGSAVLLTLQVDSNVFVNGPNFPTRGYPIDKSSYDFVLGPTTVSLKTPFPANLTPYFVLRNNDPQVDGFFISPDVQFFGGLPLNVTQGAQNFTTEFHVTYTGDTLPSLNILDAAGTYDFTGLSVFGWTIDLGAGNPIGLIFQTLEIVPILPPVCGFTAYGSASTVNSLTLQGVGSPMVGGNLRALVPGAAAGLTFVALSGQAADLPLFGGSALIDVLGLTAFYTAGSAPGGAGINLPIPADPALAGLAAYLQAAALDLAKPEGIALSNGLEVVVCP